MILWVTDIVTLERMILVAGTLQMWQIMWQSRVYQDGKLCYGRQDIPVKKNVSQMDINLADIVSFFFIFFLNLCLKKIFCRWIFPHLSLNAVIFCLFYMLNFFLLQDQNQK